MQPVAGFLGRVPGVPLTGPAGRPPELAGAGGRPWGVGGVRGGGTGP